MSGGLKVGDLYVLLSAKTSAFGKGMQDAAKLTEQVAKKIKRSATEIGQVGTVIGAAIGAAMAVAAQHNKAVATAVQDTKNIFGTFANEIGTMMLPALKSMNEGLRELLGWWQSLSPATKQHIAHWIELATAVGLAAIVIGRIAGLVAALAPVFGALGSVIAIGFGPLMLGVGAIAALIIAAAYLHRHWKSVWTSIRDIVKTVFDALAPLFAVFFTYVGDLWVGMVDNARRAANAILDIWLLVMRKTGKMNDFDASMKGLAGHAEINGLASMASSPKGIEQFAAAAFKTIGEGGLDLKKELVTMGKEVREAVEKAIGWTGKKGAYDTMIPYEDKFKREKDVHRGSRISAGASAIKSSRDIVEAANEFWKGMEALDPLGAKLVAFADQFAGFLIDAAQEFGEGIKVGANMLLGKIGDLGSVIQSAIQGAQQGGIWGAIIAVFVELLSRFKGFQQLIDIGNGQLQQFIQELTPVFEQIMPMLRNFMGASGYLVQVILKLIAPIFEVIGRVLGKIAPLIAVIGSSLESLQPLLDMLGGVLDVIVDALGYVLRFAGSTILATLVGLEHIWAGILDFVYEILGKFNQSGAFDDWLKQISAMSVSAHGQADKFEKQLNDLWNKGSTGIEGASADAAEALGKLGDTADRVGEQLTNIPQGFKVALSQFNATLATSGSGSSGGVFAFEQERHAFRQTGNATSGSPAQRTRPS
jgi:phage-related protein